jgi:hypothetical protein
MKPNRFVNLLTKVLHVMTTFSSSASFLKAIKGEEINDPYSIHYNHESVTAPGL